MDANRQQMQIAAEQDAQTDVNKLIWLAVGFALNVIGILIAYIYQPPPPASRFFEKSDEYRMFYSDAYTAKVRGIQLTYSIIGCVIPIGLVIFLWIGMAAIFTSSFLFFTG